MQAATNQGEDLPDAPSGKAEEHLIWPPSVMKTRMVDASSANAMVSTVITTEVRGRRKAL